MALCADYGITHSAFLEWEEEDRAKALAYMMEKAERCNMCGTAPWEWEQDKYAYEALRQTCFGCQKKDLAREDEHDGRMAGVSIVLLPRVVAAKLRRNTKD